MPLESSAVSRKRLPRSPRFASFSVWFVIGRDVGVRPFENLKRFASCPIQLSRMRFLPTAIGRSATTPSSPACGRNCGMPHPTLRLSPRGGLSLPEISLIRTACATPSPSSPAGGGGRNDLRIIIFVGPMRLPICMNVPAIFPPLACSSNGLPPSNRISAMLPPEPPCSGEGGRRDADESLDWR